MKVLHQYVSSIILMFGFYDVSFAYYVKFVLGKKKKENRTQFDLKMQRHAALAAVVITLSGLLMLTTIVLAVVAVINAVT